MLFKYVNDLIEEMECVNDELGYLHLDIDEKKLLNESRAAQQQSRLDQLTLEYEAVKSGANETADNLHQIDEQLNGMMKGISQLFRICKCKNDPIVQLLGDNNEIQFYNVLLYLEILEKKVHEVLLKVYYMDKINVKLYTIILFKLILYVSVRKEEDHGGSESHFRREEQTGDTSSREDCGE